MCAQYTVLFRLGLKAKIANKEQTLFAFKVDELSHQHSDTLLSCCNCYLLKVVISFNIQDILPLFCAKYKSQEQKEN
jgi:hypothetical protein